MDKLTTKEIKTLLNFIEEFSWISNKYKNLDTNKLYEVLNSFESRRQNEYNDYIFYSKNAGKNNHVSYRNSLKDKTFLIGKLPSLLMDKELFSKNKELSDFARLLGVEVRFPEKRSRDEIIGTIICSLQEEDSVKRIHEIGEFIYALTSDEKLMNEIKVEKKIYNDEYDWNNVIRLLFMGK